jgi:multiple sugar transport system substrate-binding protein
MTAGKTTPDLLQMDEKYIDSYGSKGVLASLEDQSDLDLSAFPDEVLDTGRLADGTLVGVPCGTNLYAVGVNPDVLEKAGVDMPDDTTWTWEELASISQEVSDWAKGAGEDVTGADGSLVGVDVLAAWARQSGEQTFPREDEKALTKDTIVASLEFTLSLIDSGAAPAADAQIEDSTVGLEQGIFATNRSAFHFVPSSQIVTFQEASGSPMKLLRLPARKAGDAQMVNKSSMYWSIAKESANLAGTAKLASFLLNDPEVAKILKIERGVPGTEELQETVRPLLTEGELVSLDFVQAMQAEVVTPPQVTPAGAVGFGEEYDRITQDVRFKKTSTSDAADEVLTLLKDMAG